MGFASTAGEFDLFLTFAEAFAVSLGRFVDALMACDALFKSRVRFVIFTYRAAAGMAEVKAAFFETVAYGNAAIEDEALAVPPALVLWHVF